MYVLKTLQWELTQTDHKHYSAGKTRGDVMVTVIMRQQIGLWNPRSVYGHQLPN